MHYYKRNLGDYAKKAGRLSMLQHGAYNLLIDACYDREKFPTFEEAVEWTWASTEAEIEAVRFVLSRFFRLGDDGLYVQDRILEELLDYHKKSDKNKRIAQEREAKRNESSTKRARNVHETSPKKYEAPPNQEPRTKNQVKKATTVAAPEGVSSDVWESFVQHRKSKKAPITPLVMGFFEEQAKLAGWTLESALKETCVRGWQSFKAEWVAKKSEPQNQLTAAERLKRMAG